MTTDYIFLKRCEVWYSIQDRFILYTVNTYLGPAKCSVGHCVRSWGYSQDSHRFISVLKHFKSSGRASQINQQLQYSLVNAYGGLWDKWSIISNSGLKCFSKSGDQLNIKDKYKALLRWRVKRGHSKREYGLHRGVEA